MNDTVVRARVSSELKRDTEQVFESLGLTTTEAIRMFLSQVKLRGGLPFEVVLPTANSDILRSGDQRQSALDSLYDD